jgi:hypothetical protein
LIFRFFLVFFVFSLDLFINLFRFFSFHRRDWLVSTAGMWASSAALVGSLMLWLPAPPAAALLMPAVAADSARALLTIWQALGLNFGVQVVTSMLRYLSGTGPWRVLTGKGAPRASKML